MKIIAVTEDQLILVDNTPAEMNELGGYRMKNGEWAVQFDADLGYGEIEYLDNRPNRRIYQAEFESHYSWLLDEHKRYQDHLAAEEAANDLDSTAEPSSDSRI
ncbi:hypothetical protein ACODM8_14420 [Vibrio ostreicida]|uniref:hypothetical protein n=1 Tax=Vibrio ostreicida TaxID=526588 RepID=UPI003B591306